MYKDSPHEGFSWPRYFRSTLVGGTLALLAYPIVGLDLWTASGAVVFFGLVYTLERGAVEFYKSFWREEDQSKYFIPMQFGVFGKPIKGRAKRLTVGVAYAAAVIMILCGVEAIDRAELPVPDLALVLLVGSAGGWISAFGGAWKDAPVEGFELLKFFRSPLIALGFAALLGHLSESLLLVTLGALGYTIMTIETYKTFFFPNKPRGKFAGKPILFPEMLARRNHFVPVYAAIWLAVLGAFAMAFSEPHSGLLAERGAERMNRQSAEVAKRRFFGGCTRESPVSESG
jgi:hypothetical protein